MSKQVDKNNMDKVLQVRLTSEQLEAFKNHFKKQNIDVSTGVRSTVLERIIEAEKV
jgi:antitoxin component of RelBE/YafQ-DinJ toxin-antitoxin module